MRILHLGNIANNAYNNAKLQRRAGIEADALVYDYTHVMGQPEWEDAPIVDDIGEWFTDWDSLDLGDWVRPAWFKQVQLTQPASTQRFKGEFRLRSYLQRAARSPHALAMTRMLAQAYPQHLRTSVPTLFVDVLRYLRLLPEFRRLLAGYDIVQAYATDPIIAMLSAPDTPLISFEHGTMRDIPLQDDSTGRLLTLAYHKSRGVVITNPDVVSTAQKIGLTNTTYIPHPVDEEKYRPIDTPLAAKVREEHSPDLVLFAPGRHNWAIKGNDRIVRAVARLVESGKRPLLIMCDWGQEMSRTRQLIAELGVAESVQWVPPLSKMRLLDYYNASDVVLDQFIIGTFGGIVPEAMACAKPVVLHYEPGVHEWCFPEHPPVVEAQTAEDIHQSLLSLYEPSHRKEMGERGRQWVCEHHGWKLVVDRHVELYERALAGP